MTENEIGAVHEASATQKSIGTQENKNICPECGGPLRFGSRDPCEGDYYWCHTCGYGPILFPLHYVMPKGFAPVIDADTQQAQAIARVRGARV